MRIGGNGVWFALAALLFAVPAIAAEASPTIPLPETRTSDPDGLRKRFIALFEEDRRFALRELADHALEPDWHGREDFLRYMALVEALTAAPDARLFFLVERIPDALDGERREREAKREAFLNELSFRVQLLTEGPADAGAVKDYEFHRRIDRSTLFLDRTPEPNYNTWTITYTARAVAPGETAGIAVHDAGDRYGRYPGASFMRVKGGRIFFTTPRPGFRDFFAVPEAAPAFARDGRSFYPANAPAANETRAAESPAGEAEEEAGPEMTILFESVADDCRLVRASLFQINRDAYTPAPAFTAQCELVYEWDGERYRLADKICVPDGEWGLSPCGNHSPAGGSPARP